jgi:UPF0042 nucleotide-binding protein
MRTQVVVVTGLSGAGKSTAVAALEDLGYHAVENLPPGVILQAIDACEAAGVHMLALGFSSSVPAFLDRAAEDLARLSETEGRDVRLLFLDASDEVLVRRFSETRRPHPVLAAAAASGTDIGTALVDGITVERDKLASLRAMADVVVDTSAMRVHDLRRRIFALMRPGDDASRMSIRLLSFGFKHGLPSDADLVFDARFLDNPYFVPELRPLTGLDERVRNYVLGSPDAARFVELVASLLDFAIPRYEAEGKSYLTVAIGCTGGQHRSVSLAIALGDQLRVRFGASLRVAHRDARVGVAGTPAPPEVGVEAGGGDRR